MKSTLPPDWLEPGQHLTSCLTCDYSLRGLPEVGRCPECGSAFDKRTGLWRDGNRLVMAHSAVLPLRCVKCNAEVSNLMQMRITWRHRAILLLLLTICFCGFGGVFFYLLASLFLAKTAKISLGVCPQHQQRRRRAAMAMGTVLALAGALATLAIVYQSALFGFLTAMTIFLAVGIWLRWGRIIRVTRIDKRLIWLAGVHDSFLTNLQELGLANIPPVQTLDGLAFGSSSIDR